MVKYQIAHLESSPVHFHVKKSGKSKNLPTFVQQVEFKLVFNHKSFGHCISNETFPPTYFSISCFVALIKLVSSTALWSIQRMILLSLFPVVLTLSGLSDASIATNEQVASNPIPAISLVYPSVTFLLNRNVSYP